MAQIGRLLPRMMAQIGSRPCQFASLPPKNCVTKFLMREALSWVFLSTRPGLFNLPCGNACVVAKRAHTVPSTVVMFLAVGTVVFPMRLQVAPPGRKGALELPVKGQALDEMWIAAPAAGLLRHNEKPPKFSREAPRDPHKWPTLMHAAKFPTK